MTAFSASTTAEAVVPAERQRIWDVLIDPDLVAKMTPFVRSIKADGDYWIWSMSGLEVAGVGFAPVFTERMTLKNLERIEFVHEPPNGGQEKAGVHGWYDLSEADGGTLLKTSLEICADIRAPKFSGPAVRSTMKGVMATMGDRFSKNLLKHLGVD